MANKSICDDNTYSQEEQCLNLLKSLKQTVEWMLSSCSSNVWNICGNLSHLYVIVDKILSHGLRFQTYWQFVCGLHQLQPALAPPFFPSEIKLNATTQQECFQSHLWLKKSLQDHKLSVQLQYLISDSEHLQNCYYEGAFLCNKVCTSALLTCLRAVESNQPSLLASLDPVLVLDSVSQLREPGVFVCDSNKSANLKQSCDIKKMNSLYYGHNSTMEDCDSSCSCETLVDNCLVAGSQDHLVDNVPSNINVCCCTQRVSCVHKHRWKPQYSKGKSAKSSRKKASSESGNAYYKQFLHNRSADFSSCLLPPDVVQSSSANEHATSNDKCLLSCEKTSSLRTKLHRSLSYPDAAQRSLNINRHKRSSSNSFYKSNIYPLCTVQKSPATDFANSVENSHENCDTSSCNHASICVPASEDVCVSSNRTSESDTPITHSETNCVTAPQPIPREGSTSWKAHSRSKSDVSIGRTSDDKDDDSESVLSLSLPSTVSEDKSQGKKSIFGGSQIVVPTECFFPRPHQGQSLTSFLSSNAFNICAELDRENAHFCIAEALISAIEHVKCTQSLKTIEDEDDSDEEIRSLKQRIRIRRRERQREKAIRNISLLSDGRTDTTTSQSPSSPLSSSSDGDAGMSGTDDDVEDLELSDPSNSNLSSMKESGLSLSMASLYSDADIQKAQRSDTLCATDGEMNRYTCSESNSAQLSAETVALSLLRRYSEKQLPKASDLEWLVSEQDAPQRLLPLPDSWPISPDSVEEEYNLEKTRLRGNFEWAPPRAQIIFNVHPEPRRKEVLEKQKYRCAGCGTKVEKGYISRFRYCDYLGKFFCQCCHSNGLAYIPGRILRKWDFTKYYVSKFAYELLDHMYDDPLFNIMDINNGLFKKSRHLDQTRDCRIKMFFLKDFIKTCRNAASLQEEIEQYPSHMFPEPHVYSIGDIVEVKNGEMVKKLQQLLMKCVNHVMQCVLCQAKGFICETCNNETDIIFPFQIAKVSTCNACGACFHKRCFTPGECSRCARIEERKRRRDSQKLVLSSDEET